MPTECIFNSNYRLKDGRTFTAGEICPVVVAGTISGQCVNTDGSSKNGPITFYEIDPEEDVRAPLWLIPFDTELCCWQFIGMFIWPAKGMVATVGGSADATPPE